MYIIYKKVLIYYLFPPVYIWFPQFKALLNLGIYVACCVKCPKYNIYMPTTSGNLVF